MVQDSPRNATGAQVECRPSHPPLYPLRLFSSVPKKQSGGHLTDVDRDDCDARCSYNVEDAADERTTRQSTRTVLSPPIEFVQYCWTRLAVDLPKKELHGYSIVADPLQNRACHSNSTQYDPREVKMRRR